MIARIWLAFGDLCVALKLYGASVWCFRRAARLESNSERVQLRVAWTLWKKGRVQEAELAYTRLLNASPSSPGASLGFGMLLHDQDRHAEALAVLDRAISFEERDPRLHNARGKSLAKLGRLDDAIASFRHAVALNGSFANAVGSLGAALVEARRWEEAVRWNREAMRLQSDAPFAYNLGVALAELNRPGEAEAAFRQAIAFERQPTEMTIRSRAYVAWCLSEMGRVQEAELAYTRLLDASPSSPDASLRFAVLLQEQDRHAEALAVLDRAISFEERDPRLHNARGDSLVELGRLDDAITSFRYAVALDGSFADAVGNLGGALAEARRWEEAVKWNGEAIRLRPDAAPAFNLGLALAELNRHVEAEAAFRKAIALESQPTEITTHSCALLAVEIGHQGRREEALERAESLFRSNPDDLAARNALCTILIANGQNERALAVARDTVRLHASDARAYLSLGWTYLTSRAADQALAAFERAATLAMNAPAGDVAGDVGRGAALTALGRHLEAVEVFQQILALDPEYFERDARAAEYYKESQLRLRGDQ
jgi:tetratricopeptide (TPR) repeat protein